MAYTLNKQYTNIKGLDLRVSDLLREPGAATDIKNVEFRQTGALSKRKGWQYKTLSQTGGSGLVKFNNIDITTGVITEELLNIDDDLHIYTENTFTITYTGANTAYYDMYLDPDTGDFYFDVYDNNTRVLNQNLGDGQGASDTTVTQLVAAIHAVTNFTATVSTSPTTPAAFIDIARNTTISSSGTTVSWYEWTQIDPPNNYTTPFSTHWAARNDSAFELATTATVNDVLFISNGYDELHKYDGNRVYRVGLPTPASLAVAEITGSTFALNEVYTHRIVYEYTDAKGNIIESNKLDSSATTLTGTKDLRLTIANIQDTTGFNTDQAVVNGAQSTVNTITVDSGHNIKVNDTVYISDGVTSTIVSKLVTAITSTTITVDGDSVTVADNDIISCIKIKIYRTKDAGTLYYELAEVVNDSGNSTQTYDDSTADASLSVEYVDPVKNRDLPPKCRYIDVWRSQLILTGDRENVNTVYYSDIASAEYFPQPDNTFTIAAKLGGGNSGIKALDNVLYVFKPESVATINGDLGTDTFRVDVMSDEGIGCVANGSIQQIQGRVWFLGNRGIYSIGPDSIKLESVSIEPRFKQISYSNKQVQSFHWIDRNVYIISLPVIATDGSSEDYWSSTSILLVFDTFQNAWLEWNNINMLGGMAEYNDAVYFTGRELDPVSSTAKNYSMKFLNAGTFDDYADHASGISFTYKSHWEALGEPSVFKKFLRIRLLSLDGSIDDFETDSFSIAITTEHDYLPSTVSSLTLDMSGGAAGWGNGAWGSFVWGEGRLTSRRSKLSSKKAKALRTIFTNSTAHENVLISGWEYEIATPFDMQMKE